MNKQQLLARRDYFNMVHRVTIRAIGTFSDEELDFRPRPGMRTPRELIFHIYSQERVLAEAAQEGRFTLEDANRSNPEDELGATACKALVTVTDAFADDEHWHHRGQLYTYLRLLGKEPPMLYDYGSSGA